MNIFKILWQRRERKQWQRIINNLLNKPVRAFMTPYVNSIRKDDSLLDCINIMIGEHVSCLVVEEKHKPIGIITERDFLLKAPLTPKEFTKLEVGDIMSTNVITIDSTISASEAEELMKQHNFRKLVVVDNEQIKGIVSQSDLVRIVEEEFSENVDIHGAMLCENIMQDSLTVSKTSSLDGARQRMVKHNIGCILVALKEKVLGVITEYDVVQELAKMDKHLKKLEVQDVMTDPVKCIASDLNIFEANKIMLAENVRRLPVLLNRKLVGILTQTDLCHVMYSFLRDSIDRINRHDFGDLKVRIESHGQTIAYQKHGVLKEFSLE